ncbi:polyprenyl synthetase family protein [Oerskovia flava]|uniref:polyprenyl synthetase family protein n=1 Tax=Oerskovia flava TaxID=2986422 RepID=UPI00223F38DD|nr:polyprenyl synthetase family protein [Oerskovia sp. JB1-3-2]
MEHTDTARAPERLRDPGEQLAPEVGGVRSAADATGSRPVGQGLEVRVAAALDVTRVALDEYLDDATADAKDTDAAYGALWATLGGQVGGKFLRPRLMYAAYLGLGGQDARRVRSAAVAHELLHTAMLVHDDLLDHDEVRRGRPNLAGTYRRRVAAAGLDGRRADDQVQSAALLGGDLALISAVDVVVRGELEPDEKLEMISLLVRSVHTTVAGELLDVAGQARPARDVDALRVAELKTASYTCVIPLLSGAVLAGAGTSERERLERYGSALGVAFQLVDDHLGVFGDPAVTGKSVLSDLREGKRTHLLALAHRRATPSERAVLDTHVGRPDLDEAGAALVREALHSSGAVREVRDVARERLDDARAAASRGLPPDLTSYLTHLADALADRTA